LEKLVVKAKGKDWIHTIRIRKAALTKLIWNLVNLINISLKTSFSWKSIYRFWWLCLTNKVKRRAKESRWIEVPFQHVLIWRSVKVIEIWNLKMIFCCESRTKDIYSRLVPTNLNWFERRWWLIFVVKLKTLLIS